MKKYALLAALCCAAAFAGIGVAAPAAHAGCVGLAGGVGWLPAAPGAPEPRWDGAGGIQCTTNNGDWYDLEYYFDAYRNGAVQALPRTHQIIISHGFGPGNPLPTNYKFTQHYSVECGFVSPIFGVPPYTQIRTEVLLTNERTGSTSHAVGPWNVIDTTGEYNCANGIGN